MSKYVEFYGDPNGSVFGKVGEQIHTNDGKIYRKATSEGLNMGWVDISPTPTPTPTPTATPVPTHLHPFIMPTPTPTP